MRNSICVFKLLSSPNVNENENDANIFTNNQVLAWEGKKPHLSLKKFLWFS